MNLERIDKVTGTFDRRPNDEGNRAEVPDAVVRRLPRYYRYLGDLLREGKLRISSAELSALMDVTASQIRQDLNCFGGFGQQGYGYNVKYLHQKIGELLGVEEGFGAVIVGAGNLGRALVCSHMFERRGITRLAMFDVDPALFGQVVSGVTILPLSDLPAFCKKNRVAIGVLTTPKEAAAEVAELMANAGIEGIWNFSNMDLKMPDRHVTIENIHLGDSLMKLCFDVKVQHRTGEDPV